MKRGNHSVYSLQYHIVFQTKGRKPLITDEVGDFLLENAGRLLKLWDGELLDGSYEKDFLHLLVSLNPKYAVSTIVGMLKNSLSRILKRDFKDVPSENGFWDSRYYIASEKGASDDSILEFIKENAAPRKRGRPKKV